MSCGKDATAPVPVLTTLTVSFQETPISVGQTANALASGKDQFGAVIGTGTVSWSTGSSAIATVTPDGAVTGVAPGQTTLTATAGGKQAGVAITVTPARPNCTTGGTLQLAVGDVQTLSAAEKDGVCVGGGAAASEYALIVFHATDIAGSNISLRVTASGTSPVEASAVPSVQVPQGMAARATAMTASDTWESQFRERERREVGSRIESFRRSRISGTSALSPRFLVDVPVNPTVGSVVPINANLTSNLCSTAKEIHGATVIAVLPHTIVLSDTLSPPGGYTAAEMTDFGQQFDTLGYAVDVENFGAPTDIDGNGRIAILFTPGVNVIPAPPGATVAGLFASRDLAPVSSCASSNEGEMFYLPVPDPNKTINGAYANKSALANGILSALVHEMQHLINAGRRIYVNNASFLEETWLNEGLSHIAEELLYYRRSGQTPRSNIDLATIQSSQAQVDVFNADQIANMLRLRAYLRSTENISPFGSTDLLETRGATWQLLRYAADRTGGTEQTVWAALVNSTTSGMANFNAVFGDPVSISRDWAVAQLLDDAGLGTTPNYTHPSWNYRSVLPSLNSGKFPLSVRTLLDTPIDLLLTGGGVSYLRFRVSANAPATISATASGRSVPAAVDFILVRTQ